MKKIYCLLFLAIFLNGCAETAALVGPSIGGGNAVRSSINTAISYGIKKQTGSTPIEHALSFAQKSQEAKDTSISNLKKKISKLSKVKDLN